PRPRPAPGGHGALQRWLPAVPAGDPGAVDWVGEGGPPGPELSSLGIYHPAPGPAVLKLAPEAPDFGGRRLVGHDVKHVVEWWLIRGTPPDFDDVAVGAYLLNPARRSYKLADVSAGLLGEGPGLGGA